MYVNDREMQGWGDDVFSGTLLPKCSWKPKLDQDKAWLRNSIWVSHSDGRSRVPS